MPNFCQVTRSAVNIASRVAVYVGEGLQAGMELLVQIRRFQESAALFQPASGHSFVMLRNDEMKLAAQGNVGTLNA